MSEEPTPQVEPVAKSNSLRWLLLGAVGFLLLAYAGMFLAVGSNVAIGTRVGTVSVGGMTTAEAKQALFKHAQNFTVSKVTIVFDGKTIETTPAELGIVLDQDATIAQLPVRSANPLTLIQALVSGIDVAPVFATTADYDAAIDSLVADSETPAQDASIRYQDEQMVVVPSVLGHEVNRESTRAQLLAAALVDFKDPIELKLEEVAPQVDDHEAQQFIADELGPLISEPITITVKDKPGLTTTFSPENLRRSVRFRAQDGAITAYLAPGILALKCNEEFLAATQPVQDATWDVSSGKPVVVPAKSGFGVSNEALATAAESVWQLSGSARTAEVEFGMLNPELSTAAVEALGVKELMSSYTQHFPAAAYRSQNIGQAAAYINGTLLMPGETYSMNDTIKERTEANGYTSGWIIGQGGVFRYEPGGGVSTATTAMFNGAWFAGLQFKEWRAHSIFISRYPAGREATVSWGSLDMRFRNQYDTAVFITTRMTKTSVSVYFWGTKHWDEVGSESGLWRNQSSGGKVYNSDENCHTQAPVPGFDITVYRTFKRHQVPGDATTPLVEVKREPFNTHYKATPTVICSSDPAPTSTKKPTKKPTKTPTATATETATDTATATETP